MSLNRESFLPSTLAIAAGFLGAAPVAGSPLTQEPGTGQPTAAGDSMRFRGENGLEVLVRETTIGFMDPSLNPETLRPSPDGRGVAYVVMGGDGLNVVHNGVRGELYEGIDSQSLRFSPNGERLAYAAIREGVRYVVVDGVAHNQNITKHGINFSPDSEHVYWIAGDDAEQYVVIDGEEGPRYPGIGNDGIVFTAAGRYAYVAILADDTLSVVIDGVAGPAFKKIRWIGYSADGEHFAYVAAQDKKYFVFFGHELVGEYDNLTQDFITLSDEGGRCGFVGLRGEDWYVVIDGEESGPFNHAGPVRFSPSGTNVAYLAAEGEGLFIVIDGEPVKDYDSYDSISFGPREDQVAFTASRGVEYMAVVDGVEGPGLDAISGSGVFFSPDGEHYAYQATKDGRQVIVLDGKVGPPFVRLDKDRMRFTSSGRLLYATRGEGSKILYVDGEPNEPFDEIRNITDSPDGARYAYAARRGNAWFVVVDGEPVGPYTRVKRGSIVFSPDGEHLAYVISKEGKNFVVEDGVQGPPFDHVLQDMLSFTPDGEYLLYAATSGDERYLVVDGLLMEGGWEGFLSGSSFRFEDDRRFFARGNRKGKLLLIEGEIRSE